ncbi:TatD family hydrolase [Parapedobacter pyrenivorans]|uniref:TatD family hydrolase n=1 Tax=Parapedobacter pyrenivorans TaxID=1305674 RepID=A0A917HR68_9SPHI|nr:TatD family hydrolase [Parapedobacter pyrenivorans]GGG87115.1 TatD family hydrolase [Parapedobacter pyrenivorans]
MTLTDTHTHLYYLYGTPDLAIQMQRCFDNDVRHFLLPNVDSESIPKVLGTAAAYPGSCYAMMGLHPCSVKTDYLDELATIEQIIADNKIYGIGEIGIDLHWEKTTLPLQQEAFRIQTRWAKDLGLPVSIHCRDAFDELFQLLDEVQDGRLRGVLHCFTGNSQQAQRTIDLGLHLGIGGVVTYKNAGLDAVVANLDLRHIVLETDAPYLAPVPYRGKKNESSYLLHIAQKIADLHGVTLATVAATTTENAKRVFGI